MATIPRLIFAALLFTSLIAQSHAAASHYDVEIIVFSQNTGDNNEEWPSAPGTPEMEKAVQLKPDDSAFGLLPASAYKLTTEENRLRNASHTRPLLHVAWRQAAVDRKHAKAVALQTETTNPVVEGTAIVSVNRYLHLNLDLLLSSGGDDSYRLQAHRRMRSGELHYIDHPRIGVLVKITPVEG
jgi:hypothetical protein